MNNEIHALFNLLDKELIPLAAGGHLDMYLLGRGSLVLSHNFGLMTKDIDFVQRYQSDLEKTAIELSGKGSKLAQSVGLYLDPVPSGLPPLPSGFEKRSTSILGPWKVLRIWVLDMHDLATTKLKSFRPQDREDLQLLCDRGLLNSDKLRESLERAFPFRSPKDDDAEDDRDTPDWGKALRNLNRVDAYLTGSITSI